MESEREHVLREVVNESVDQDSALTKLEVALLEAEKTKRLAMSHAHDIAMRKAELGWFGRLFGGEANAATIIALIVILFGFGIALWLWILAYRTGQAAFWSSEAHIALAAATTALGYVFGRGSKER